jgi:DNA-3-methyladenine glycosylase I
MMDSGVDFSNWLWDFVDGKPIVNHWKTLDEVPATTPLSETVSKELKARGFTFVGPTIVYAVLQSAGIVNDHLVSCFRWSEAQTIG